MVHSINKTGGSMQLIPNIGLAKFKLHPTRNAQEHEIVSVLSHNKTVFYTVSPERMEQLLKAEMLIEKVEARQKAESEK